MKKVFGFLALFGLVLMSCQQSTQDLELNEPHARIITPETILDVTSGGLSIANTYDNLCQGN